MSLNAQQSDPLTALIGHWRVHRAVFDFRGAPASVFSGRAEVTETGFSENGEILIGDRKFPASRAYRLERQGGCGYAGRFIFRGADEWGEAWRVKGPRKNYASLGRFSRL